MPASPQIQRVLIPAIIANITELQILTRDLQILKETLVAYEDGGSAPDIAARAVANVLHTEHPGWPTDGTFTVTSDGNVSEFPLTFGGLEAAVEHAGEVRGVLDFRPGPDGAYASIQADIKVQDEVARLEAEFGPAQGRA